MLTLTSLTYIFWNTACAASILTMVLSETPYFGGALPFSIWLGLNILCFFIFSLYLKKERSYNAAFIFAFILYCAEAAALIFCFFRRFDFNPLLAFFCCTAAAFSFCCFYSAKPPSSEKLLTRFEFSVFIIGFNLLVDSGWNLGGKWLLPFISATILCLLCMLFHRIFGEDVIVAHPRLAILAAAFSCLVLLLVAFIAISQLSIPYEAGIAAFFALIFSVVSFVGRYINAFLLYLLSLLPEAEDSSALAELYAVPKVIAAEAEVETETSPYLIPIVFVFAAVLVIGLLFYTFKGKKFKLSSRSIKTASHKRIAPSLFSIFRNILSRLIKTIRLRILLFHKRNTYLGFYYWLSNRKSPICPKPIKNETPLEFFSRVAEFWPAEKDTIMAAGTNLCAELYAGAVEQPFMTAELKRKYNLHCLQVSKSALQDIAKKKSK